MAKVISTITNPSTIAVLALLAMMIGHTVITLKHVNSKPPSGHQDHGWPSKAGDPADKTAE